MQFNALLLSVAFAALAQAVEFTNSGFSTITAGQPFTITWTEATGPVTILLKNGPALNLVTVSTIGSGLSGGSFTWNVPATLTADTYALEIQDSTATPNYSTQWELIGGVPASTTAISRSVTPTATGSGSTVSQTGSQTESASTTGTASTTASTESSSTTGSVSSSVSRSVTTSTRATTSASTTPSSAPAGGMASGLTSNLALVFVAAGALFMIN